MALLTVQVFSSKVADDFATAMKSSRKLSFASTSPPAITTSQTLGMTSTTIYAYFAYLTICAYTLEEIAFESNLSMTSPSATLSFATLCSSSELESEVTFERRELTRVCNSLWLIEPSAPLPSNNFEYKSSVIALIDMLYANEISIFMGCFACSNAEIISCFSCSVGAKFCIATSVDTIASATFLSAESVVVRSFLISSRTDTSLSRISERVFAPSDTSAQRRSYVRFATSFGVNPTCLSNGISNSAFAVKSASNALPSFDCRAFAKAVILPVCNEEFSRTEQINPVQLLVIT